MFIDDEISTGNTILNFIKEFQSQDIINKNVQFLVGSICNWQNKANKRKFKEHGIKTVALITGEIRDVDIKMNIDESDVWPMDVPSNERQKVDQKFIMCNTDYFNKRILGDKVNSQLDNVLDIVLSDIRNKDTIKSVRVIGTEECMTPAIQLALKLRFDVNEIDDIICHSTTRSKIDVLKSKEGLLSRAEVKSPYDSSRKTYIYNIDNYKELTIIVTDAEDPSEFIDDITSKLNTWRIIVVNLR